MVSVFFALSDTVYPFVGLKKVFQVRSRACKYRSGSTGERKTMTSGLRMREKNLVFAFLILLNNPLTLTFLCDIAVNNSVRPTLRLELMNKPIPLMLPVEEHNAVLARFDEITNQFVSFRVQKLVLTTVVVHGAGCTLQQFAVQHSPLTAVTDFPAFFRFSHLSASSLLYRSL